MYRARTSPSWQVGCNRLYRYQAHSDGYGLLRQYHNVYSLLVDGVDSL